MAEFVQGKFVQGEFVQGLRSGTWLTLERVRLIGWIVLALSIASVLFLILTSDGLVDYEGRPLGTDFSNVYAAGTFALEGHPGAPYDHMLQLAREKDIFGPGTPLYSWHYPPIFLIPAAALAKLPYWLALALWQIGTLLLYVAAISATVKIAAPSVAAANPQAARLWLLLALAFPAVLVNLGHGNNGFMSTALLAGGLALLDRRPVAAGILFGLLAYKPQFGVMIPLVLAVTGRWRTIGAAAATVAITAGLSLLMFGPEAWRAFFDSMQATREAVLEQGGPGFHKIQSVFAWARMWGSSIPVAYAVQGALTLAIAAGLVWLWRAPVSFALKAAALSLCTILVTPYSLDYDLMLAAPAIAWLIGDGLERGFAPYEKTALAALWTVPMIARSFALGTNVPLGVAAILITLALILRRARADLGQS